MSRSLPLAVDLDGTLFRGDLFSEGILRYVGRNPFRVFVVIGWLFRGLVYAKARIAQVAPFDPRFLPYNSAFLDWLKHQRASGRVVVMASAAAREAAECVALHVGVFDTVFATDNGVNLKAASKAERLAKAFPGGFAYAGNDAADLKVWRCARAAVIVNAPAGLASTAAKTFEVERSFPRPSGVLRPLLKAMRVQQWSKNLLVFLPPILAHAAFQASIWIAATEAFIALSLVASSVYLVNDLVDIDADRRHHRKRNRPFADGSLSLGFGLIASAVLAIAGITIGFLGPAGWYVVLYLAASSAYTFWLKHKQLVDVFLLAGLYMIRVFIGGIATGYEVSSWLLAFCCFFFLSLALVKRVVEIETVLAPSGAEKSRGYFPTDGPILSIIGVGSGLVSCLILSLYFQDQVVRAHYSEPLFLWVQPACVMLWLSRIWLIAGRGEMHDDPLVFALRDRTSWLLGGVIVLGFLAATYAPADFQKAVTGSGGPGG